jgi:hypothetical protein
MLLYSPLRCEEDKFDVNARFAWNGCREGELRRSIVPVRFGMLPEIIEMDVI